MLYLLIAQFILIIEPLLLVGQVNKSTLNVEPFYISCNLQRVSICYNQGGILAGSAATSQIRNPPDLGRIVGDGFQGLVLRQTIGSSLGRMIRQITYI